MDGGFIVTGSTQNDSLNATNILLLKVDASGTEEWSFTFGGGLRARGFSVQQTTDGGYILTGQIWVDGLGYAILIKTDGNGTEEWNRLYGVGFDGEPLPAQFRKAGRSTQIGQAPLTGEEFFSKGQAPSELFGSACSAGCLGFEAGLSVKQTMDGGYIIAGETQSFSVGSIDVWLIKTNSEGSTEWYSVFGGTSRDEATSVEQTADGGFIICGSTWSYGLAHSRDVWIIKTDAQGTESWSKTYGGKASDDGKSIQQTNDGGFIIAGETYNDPNSFAPDVLLIKIDALGNEKWFRTFGEDDFESGHAVQQTWDGGYIIAGTYTDYSRHIWLLKTDGNGNIESEEE